MNGYFCFPNQIGIKYFFEFISSQEDVHENTKKRKLILNDLNKTKKLKIKKEIV